MADAPNDEGYPLSHIIEDLRAEIRVLEEMIAQSHAALARMEALIEALIEANLEGPDHPEKS